MKFNTGDYVMVCPLDQLHLVGVVGVGAATIFGPRDDDKTIVLDLNTMGNHLPQYYQIDECTPLDIVNLEDHGFCPICRGFGVVDIRKDVSRLDDLLAGAGTRCPDCKGSGKSYMTVHIFHMDNESYANMEVDQEKVAALRCEICRNASTPM